MAALFFTEFLERRALTSAGRVNCLRSIGFARFELDRESLHRIGEPMQERAIALRGDRAYSFSLPQ